MTMHCPHALLSPCSTCEESAAARELRALRIVADAARVVAMRYAGEPVAALARALAAVPTRKEHG